AIEEVLRAEREPLVRRPEQIRAGLLLLPGRLAGLDRIRRIREQERHAEVAGRPLQPAEQARRELLIDGAAVPPRRRPVAVVVELVEARVLRRLERLVVDERALQSAERRGTERRVPERGPHDAELRVRL